MALLGLMRTTLHPTVINQIIKLEIAIWLMMILSLTINHHVFNGVVGTLFTTEIIRDTENSALFLLEEEF